MRFPVKFISATSIALSILLSPSCTKVEERDYYELKIFRYDSASQEKQLDHYLESAYLPGLHRAGIRNVGVFKMKEDKNETTPSIILLVPFTSLEQFAELSGKLQNDPIYLEEGAAFFESTHNDPPYKRIESNLLKAFSSTPKLVLPDLSSPRPERIYELRSYEAATERLFERKVEMFNSGEVAIFQRLGFNPVFFGEVISSSHMPHLMYMTTFADTSSQKECWEAFRTDPAWMEMKEMEQYQNTVSHIDRYLLYPTSYSDY